MNIVDDKIEQLEYYLEELPHGYISKKNINGKVQYYLQWQENGKKKSKYISNKDYLIIEKQIEERKRIQEELKELKKYVFKEESVKYKTTIFKTIINIGKSLISYVNEVSSFKKRDCFSKIQDYLYDHTSGKVFILYGLRRTGKTTLMRQAIYEMSDEDKSKTAYIQVNSKNSLADINLDLRYLENHGYKYIFIDEVTLMEDFIQGAALLSDVFASSGMKIILSGTDSLGFMFAQDEQLYDRCIFLHTTLIPYREFERVLGIKGIDEYIRYGGTMSLSGVNYNESVFNSERSTNYYVDSAIARNIQHSLKCYQYEGHFRALYELYEKNELTSAINRVIEDMNHAFTLEVLTREFQSNDLGISATNLRKDNNILDRIDKHDVTKKIKEMLKIKNKEEQSVILNDSHRYQIKEYLELLDLIVDMPIHSIPVENKKLFRSIFTQPGMRYCMAEALIKSLLKDAEFQTLSIEERNFLLKRITSEIKGRMLEDIILLETSYANPNKEVFKLQFGIGEFDMVVVDEEKVTCDIYEIKYSDIILKEQYKNLIDEDKCNKTSFRYGKIVNKYVIYRGKNTTLDNGIIYLNVEEYLMNLEKCV